MTEISSSQKKPHIAICMPVAKDVHPGTTRSLISLRKPRLPEGSSSFLDTVGLPIPDARRVLTRTALSMPETTHILWIDSDMIFPADSLQRLMAHDQPVVGGLCHNRRHPYQPILAKIYGDSWGLDPMSLGWVYDYPENQLFQVDGTGGAFLLVKREVFEDIEKKFGKESWWESLHGCSEDLSFCHRARACGYPIAVDTGLEIGHVGEVVITSDFAKRNRRDKISEWYPESWKAMGKPLASIIIPTWNQNPKILKAAVASARGQTVPVEVIVVDDGSDRPLPELPADVKVIRHEKNMGPTVALNTGIKAMTTDWFCWCSSDDLFAPTKVEIQLKQLLAANSKVGYHGYNCIDFDTSSLIRVVYAKPWNSILDQMQDLTKVCCINMLTSMIHRSVFEDVGVFDESYRYSQDWELMCRIGTKYVWTSLNRLLATRREGRNLTEMLVVNQGQKKRRDDEDARIREQYAIECCQTCHQPL